jgi:hypothetical protein
MIQHHFENTREKLEKFGRAAIERQSLPFPSYLTLRT